MAKLKKPPHMTYTGLAATLVGIALPRLIPGLPADVTTILTPDVTAIVAELLQGGGLVVAAVGRYLAKPSDKQSVVTPRP